MHSLVLLNMVANYLHIQIGDNYVKLATVEVTIRANGVKFGQSSWRG